MYSATHPSYWSNNKKIPWKYLTIQWYHPPSYRYIPSHKITATPPTRSGSSRPFSQYPFPLSYPPSLISLCILAYTKTALLLGRNLLIIDPVDRYIASPVQSFHQLVDHRLSPLHLHMYRSVVFIPDPSGQSQGSGKMLRPVSEPHSLYSSVKNQAFSYLCHCNHHFSSYIYIIVIGFREKSKQNQTTVKK